MSDIVILEMVTYTGKYVRPFDMHPGDIDIHDIAHGLSNCCRFAGQCKWFYSVAQHSYLMARMLENRTMAKIALLHDATEAYLGDLTTAVKRGLPDYQKAEDNLWRVIAQKFELPYELPQEVIIADYRMLVAERIQLIGEQNRRWKIEWDYAPYDIHISPMTPADASLYFQSSFRVLFQ